jgi:hypothetical protein
MHVLMQSKRWKILVAIFLDRYVLTISSFVLLLLFEEP